MLLITSWHIRTIITTIKCDNALLLISFKENSQQWYFTFLFSWTHWISVKFGGINSAFKTTSFSYYDWGTKQYNKTNADYSHTCKKPDLLEH